MKNITEIDESAITMTLSVIQELSKKGVKVSGTKPDSPVAAKVLERSGFFSHMVGRISEENKTTKNTILTTGYDNTNHKKIAAQVREAVNTVWGNKGRNPILYGTIVEMLRNSCDHAFNKKAQTRWHLSLCHQDEAKKVKFSFVDNGKGIIKSFENDNIMRKIFNFLKSEQDILKTAFENGIESRTGLRWRGKGLPCIYEAYADNYIKGLKVITNKAFLDFDNKLYLDLDHNFQGTYYFWILDRTCAAANFN